MLITWYSGNVDKYIESHPRRSHLEAVLSRLSKEREKERKGERRVCT